MAISRAAIRQAYKHPVPRVRRRSRLRKFADNVVALIVGAGLILLMQWMTKLPTSLDEQVAANTSSQSVDSAIDPASDPIVMPHVSASLRKQPNHLASPDTFSNTGLSAIDPTSLFPDNYSAWLTAKNFDKLRPELLDLAMQAVRENNHTALADNLLLLGITELAEYNADSANVYLQEALAVFEELGDDLGRANVHIQLGRMHIVERQRARRAAMAYDSGLLARVHISNGLFHDAAPVLHRAIEENIELSRYGAAARDYETLSAGYLEHGQWQEAANTAIEAAKLHAASGRREKARSLINGLVETGVQDFDINALNNELTILDNDYERSVEQMGRARDYQQLYHHFIAEGDPVRAWQFRVQADASLKKASKRARYRRQAGVLVLLYNSNDNMRKARQSLSTAHSVFTTQSLEELAVQSEQLMREVY